MFVEIDMPDDEEGPLQRAQGGDSPLQGPTHAAGTVEFRAAIQKLDQVSYRVCRIATPWHVYGTGFLVGPKWILTNYHVVKDFIQGVVAWKDFEAQFDFDGYGATIRKAQLDMLLHPSPCLFHKPSSLVDQDYHSTFKRDRWNSNDIDFALLQLQDDVGFDVIDLHSGACRGWITLLPKPILGGGGMILQFPQGAPLRWDFAGFSVPQFNSNKTRIRYLIATDHGSSGSPCLDNNSDVIALHHAGRYHNRATPQKMENQGIPIACIVASIQANVTGFDFIGKYPPLAKVLIPAETALLSLLQAMIVLGEDPIIRATAIQVLGSCPVGAPGGTFTNRDLMDLVRLAKCEINGAQFEAALRAARVVGRSAPALQPNFDPLFVGADSPWINRQELGTRAKQLLQSNSTVGLCVTGEPDTGRSHLYYYFVQLSGSLDFKLCRIRLEEIAASGQPVVDALLVAKAIDKAVGLRFDFSNFHKSSEVYKYEEFQNALRAKFENSTTKIVVFIDGLDAAAATTDALELLRGLLDTIMEHSLTCLRFILVGVTRDTLNQMTTCAGIATRNFSIEDVHDWFMAAHEKLPAKPGLPLSQTDKLKAIGEIVGKGRIDVMPNVERIGKAAASVFERFTL